MPLIHSTLFCFLALLISVFPLSTYGEKQIDRYYAPVVELSGKWGHSTKKSSQRSIARLGTVVPVYQKMDHSLAFITAIVMGDTNSNFEGNFGAGYRHFIFNNNWFIGGYGFYDRRKTKNGNFLQQITLGLEAVSINLEIRGNIYLPFSQKRAVNNRTIFDLKYDSTRQVTIIRNSSQESYETAMK